jgi:hypothetical protein
MENIYEATSTSLIDADTINSTLRSLLASQEGANTPLNASEEGDCDCLDCD